MSFYPNLDRDQEIAYLKTSLEAASTRNNGMAFESHVTMLEALNTPPSQSRKEYADKYPLFTATLDYFATGEGRTLIFAARRKASMREWVEYLCGEISGYYCIGVNVYEGLPPDDDGTWKFLVSPQQQKFLRREADASSEGRGGHVEVFLHQHVNYS